MKIRLKDLEEEPRDPSAPGRMIGGATGAYKNIYRKLSVRREDPLWLAGLKILGQFLMVFLLILLSPFLLIGLAVAFAAVL